MRNLLIGMMCVFGTLAVAADDLTDRWAAALGGREKLAAVKAVYREATLDVQGYSGTVKVWHTADGKYRKEEQIATLSAIEVFDGTRGAVQQAGAPRHEMTAADLTIARSKAFANWNAAFFVFFPDRRRGTLVTERDAVVMKPEGGIEWRITLDPTTSLPKTMAHTEGSQPVTVNFVAFEEVDGLKFEKEIHRSNGQFDLVIRFTKTVINPSIDESLFSLK